MDTPKRGRPVYRFLPIKITKHESSRNIIISSETSQYKIFFCWHRTFRIPPFLLLLVNTIIIVNNKLLYRGRKNFVIVSSPWKRVWPDHVRAENCKGAQWKNETKNGWRKWLSFQKYYWGTIILIYDIGKYLQ